MAANLARSGCSLRAWNRTPTRLSVRVAAEAGATIVASIQAAVESAEVIFTCVGDETDVEEVLLGEQGITQFAPANALIVDLSTIGSKAAQHIGTELARQGFRFLDAPISGGDIGAKNGTLTIMVGGEAQDFEECQPFLAMMGQNIRLCGPIGSGQAVKLCNQVLGAVHMVALCEAMLLAEKQGIDPHLIVEVCSTGAAGSWALANLGEKAIAADFAPGFAIKHMLKDLRLVLDCARDRGQDLPGVELADCFFQIVQALDGGAGDEQGTQAMIRAYRERNDEG